MKFITKTKREILKLNNVLLEEGMTVPILQYPALEGTNLVKHCFSTRLGGVSEGIYASMNLSFTRGDEERLVRENFKRIAKAMDVSCENFVFTDQTHTTNVRAVSMDDAGHGLTRKKEFYDVDGLITNTKNLVLSTFYADCVPLYFLDPVNEAIGLSHSGWRGTVNRMGKVTIDKMKQAFGTKPKDLICAIGPSICMACYEVSEDVASNFRAEFNEYKDDILLEKENDKYQLDLWRANELVLLMAGVKKQNIHTTNICTCCNEQLLFSHRASEGKRGNLGAFMCLK